jgi:hypothetical protein
MVVGIVNRGRLNRRDQHSNLSGPDKRGPQGAGTSRRYRMTVASHLAALLAARR